MGNSSSLHRVSISLSGYYPSKEQFTALCITPGIEPNPFTKTKISFSIHNHLEFLLFHIVIAASKLSVLTTGLARPHPQCVQQATYSVLPIAVTE